MQKLASSLDWNTDSGATSHMTPHRHWMHNYTPLHLPIRLANDLIVYSAGMDSVVFNPTIKGKKTCSVEVTRVLHVPDLKSNLLSILYLTCHKQFTIHINSDEIRFPHNNKLLFTTQINENNTAFLDGSTKANLEAANSVSALPFNVSLWHRHFAHHDHNLVKQMISKQLVTGLKIESNEVPDPICEPCLSGKMNAILKYKSDHIRD